MASIGRSRHCLFARHVLWWRIANCLGRRFAIRHARLPIVHYGNQVGFDPRHVGHGHLARIAPFGCRQGIDTDGPYSVGYGSGTIGFGDARDGRSATGSTARRPRNCRTLARRRGGRQTLVPSHVAGGPRRVLFARRNATPRTIVAHVESIGRGREKYAGVEDSLFSTDQRVVEKGVRSVSVGGQQQGECLIVPMALELIRSWPLFSKCRKLVSPTTLIQILTTIITVRCGNMSAPLVLVVTLAARYETNQKRMGSFPSMYSQCVTLAKVWRFCYLKYSS
mmetsp:Transcript_8501/g.18346  ORF Transcript_8501/g.18346 Transcript_8501/m.18346 type:complete len:280 (-) Transcript_8501:50-889(-)